jgi:hypothetical protein
MDPKLISVSDLIKSSWNLYAKNIKILLLPISLLIPPYLLLYLFEYLTFPGQNLIVLILVALSIFMNLWISVFFIEMINKICENQAMNLNELFQSSMEKIASYFWVAILVGLITFAGLILLIIPGLIFAIWYAFAEYIVVLENKKGLKALLASKELVKGRWGATFWRLILPALLFYVAGIAIALVLTLTIGLGNVDFTSLNENLMFNASSTFVFIILSPLFTAYGIILYNSLKETKIISPKQ